MSSESSIASFVDNLIAAAHKQGASDIHLEPGKDALRVRFRVDGILHDYEVPESIDATHVIARVKLLANLDVAERRIPQDGKFQYSDQAGALDIRVSTFPSVFGQTCVLRLLHPASQRLSMHQLGIVDDVQQKLLHALHKEHGFIIVTGPTGSGKTTTLYAAIDEIQTPEKNIITLEDPIEYHCPDITQGHINPDVGFTFEAGIRSMLRQDPDVVMIGEIRDKQTARIAIEAALTGHLVLSTLHTNDAPRTLMRLMDMGIDPYLLNTTISCIVAQRLVRKLCDSCKQERTLTAAELLLFTEHGFNPTKVYGATGCDACSGTGYKGRVGLFEVVVMTDALRSLIVQHPSFENIQQQVIVDGYVPLFVDGLRKVIAGVTSLSEVMRVIA